jgi:uncharacterized membrane protein HdeD (DUF308 family)
MQASPEAGALGLIWAIAAYAIVIGIFMVMLAFRVRSHHNRMTAAAQPGAAR